MSPLVQTEPKYPFSMAAGRGPKSLDHLLANLTVEHHPSTCTEHLLILEMAPAQRELNHVAISEAQMLADPAAVGQDPSRRDDLLKLSRYEQGTHRTWYKALEQRNRLRRTANRPANRAAASSVAAEPVPAGPHQPALSKSAETNRIPAHLRRDPLFHPIRDRSQIIQAPAEILRP